MKKILGLGIIVVLSTLSTSCGLLHHVAHHPHQGHVSNGNHHGHHAEHRSRHREPRVKNNHRHKYSNLYSSGY